MKAECMDCGKIISNPFVDTDSKGRLYFFCNKEHRDKYEEQLINIAFFMNPISSLYIAWLIAWNYIKSLFRKTNQRKQIY